MTTKKGDRVTPGKGAPLRQWASASYDPQQRPGGFFYR